MSAADDLQMDENEDNVLSMVDVLQESEELEEEATAVLGDSDDKCCTYPVGYGTRQALYACATCKVPASDDHDPAGVCLACSYECHEGHQLYELYTKRHFRCDCGNDKFGSMKCKLVPDKVSTNPDNKYNQNFRGVYCICSRPYPDPEDEIEDEMIQCVVCEDWFHGRHLGVSVPDNIDYHEMVCTQCMDGPCGFLWYYNITSKEVKVEKEDSASDVDVEKNVKDEPVCGREDKKDIPVMMEVQPTELQQDSTNETQPSSVQQAGLPTNWPDADITSTVSEITPTCHNSDQRTMHSTPENSTKCAEIAGTSTTNHGQLEKVSPDDDAAGSSSGSDHRQIMPKAGQNGTGADDVYDRLCKLKELKLRQMEKKSHATFWQSGWRYKLCTCEECKILYETNHVAFLLDNSDTMLAYEERGKIKHAGSSTSQYAMGMEALTRLNRVKQVEVLHEYNDLKSSLSEYLQSFASAGKVVKRQDIDEFFTDMKSRKRQRIEEPAIQHFCR